MREIKFRAWNQSTKTMIDLQLITPLALSAKLTVAGLFIPFDDKIPVMQYTGLKDKNGKEIYEGDILLLQDEYTDKILDDGSGPTEPFNHLSAVVFESGTFGLDVKERGDDFDIGFWPFPTIIDYVGIPEFEVIGNVYENPELKESK